MDDSYIHLRYGRSILSGHPLQLLPGEPSAGFTSPLWLVPSALASLAGRMSAAPVLMLLSLLATLAGVLLAGPVAGAVIAFAGPVAFHSGSGMETGLAVLLLVLVWKSLESGRWAGARPWLLAAAVLTRPELCLLALPMLMAEEGWRRRLLLLLPALAAGLLWVAWDLYAIGRPLPASFYAKQSGAWSSPFSALRGLAVGLLLSSPLLFVAGGAGMAKLLREGAEGDRRRGRALAAIPLLLLGSSVVMQPNAWFQMRYHVPGLVAVALAASVWLPRIRKSRGNVALLLLTMLPGLVVFAGRRAGASEDVWAIDVAPALDLAGEATSGDTVAVADAGAAGWLTDLAVLDVDGLVTPVTMGMGMEELAAWVPERADWLLVFPGQYAELVGRAGKSLLPVREFESPSPVICGEGSVVLYRTR